jgi:hypothetical protein
MLLTVVFYVQFGLGLLFACNFLFAPKMGLKSYGIEDPMPAFVMLTQLYGSVILMYALIAWYAAGIDDSVIRRGITIVYAISMGSGLVVFLVYMLKKTLSSFGWIPTFLNAAFTALYAYSAAVMKV